MINLSSYQKAIYEELAKLGYNVYDEGPEEAKFPYIVIGDIDFSEGQNNFNDLLDINLNILVWSLWEGKKEVNDILSNIINIFTNLHEKRLENQSKFRDPNKAYYLPICTFANSSHPSDSGKTIPPPPLKPNGALGTGSLQGDRRQREDLGHSPHR